MNWAPLKIDSQLVYLDPFLMDRLRLNAGLSRKKLATKAGLAVGTVLEAFNGGGLQPEKARLLAKHLGGEVTELLAVWDPRYKAPLSGRWTESPEWEVAGYLDQGRLAANGLYYIVCRMQHRFTRGKKGRGKFYHLSWIPPAAREGIQEKLSRHSEVCGRVGVHQNIVVNLSSTPVSGAEGWWVIDDWTGEKTLRNYIQLAAWPRETLPKLLLDIAEGLDALHRANIVFRELATARVLIAEQDGRAILSDFELAKLLDSSPSVSSEWPEDEFRAPEVGNGDVSPNADLYSFAYLTASALRGGVPKRSDALQGIREAGLPKGIHRLLLDSLEPLPKNRPAEIAPLLKELRRWAKH